MANILFINACARPCSRTYLLAQPVLKKLKALYDCNDITEVNLYKENLRPLDFEMLEKRSSSAAASDFSSPYFKYARQFAAADEIVIAAPYWDLSFPSILRIYLEHVAITGLTFEYNSDGIPVGLCNAKRITYVTTSGGPVIAGNIGYNYIKTLAETFYKIPEVICFKAENLDIAGNDADKILNDSINLIEQYIF